MEEVAWISAICYVAYSQERHLSREQATQETAEIQAMEEEVVA